MTSRHARFALLVGLPLLAVPSLYLLSVSSVPDGASEALTLAGPPRHLAQEVPTPWSVPKAEAPLAEFVMVPEAKEPPPLPTPPVPVPVALRIPAPPAEVPPLPPPPAPELAPIPGVPLPVLTEPAPPPPPIVVPAPPPPVVPAPPVPMTKVVELPEPVVQPKAPPPMPIQRVAVPIEPLPKVRVQEGSRPRLLPLTGTYLGTLERDRCLSLPTALRSQLGEATFMISPGSDTCLWLTTPAHLERVHERLEQVRLRQDDVRAFRRLYFAQAERATADDDGRLVLPERLCEFAALDGEIVLVGADDHIEVWDSARWRKKCSETARNGEE